MQKDSSIDHIVREFNTIPLLKLSLSDIPLIGLDKLREFLEKEGNILNEQPLELIKNPTWEKEGYRRLIMERAMDKEMIREVDSVLTFTLFIPRLPATLPTTFPSTNGLVKVGHPDLSSVGQEV